MQPKKCKKVLIQNTKYTIIVTHYLKALKNTIQKWDDKKL